MPNNLPLSLYIHIPWCVKKCPYCDFNSYAVSGALEEARYSQLLLRDLEQDSHFIQNRSLKTIFFGGGTPSLFSPRAIENILAGVQKRISFDPDIEITLEANPGTLERHCFTEYKLAGINRISIGAQSFQTEKLKALGRIHSETDIIKAIHALEKANLSNFNIDLMYGLPNQTINDALFDLKTALDFNPPHLSWYNLTIEPNTIFHQKPPVLPNDEMVWQMENEGKAILAGAGLNQYEVSAFSKAGNPCRHNLNYWEFGDYLGIGAGAHGKITDTEQKTITRYAKTRYPKTYLETNENFIAQQTTIAEQDLPFEFMLNALRLTKGFEKSLFESRTLLSWNTITPPLKKALEKELLIINNQNISPSPLGKRFLNDLILLFRN